MQFVKYDHNLKIPPQIQGAAMEYPLTAVTILCAVVILDCLTQLVVELLTLQGSGTTGLRSLDMAEDQTGKEHSLWHQWRPVWQRIQYGGNLWLRGLELVRSLSGDSKWGEARGEVAEKRHKVVHQQPAKTITEVIVERQTKTVFASFI